MNFIPFENITISSPLTNGEIEDVIKHTIESNTKLGLTFTKDSIKEYEGFVGNKNFRIRRILKSGINSFIPIVSGSIHKKENGSKIQLKLRLHKIVSILAIVMTLFFGSLLIMPILNNPLKGEQFKELVNDELIKETLGKQEYKKFKDSINPKEIDSIGFLLFFSPYLMCILFFNYEARIVKNKLKEILKAENNFN